MTDILQIKCCVMFLSKKNMCHVWTIHICGRNLVLQYNEQILILLVVTFQSFV